MTKICCVMLFSLTMIFSQDKMKIFSIEEVVKLATNNKTIINKYESQLLQNKANIEIAKKYPNPKFSISTESLESSTNQVEETIISVEFPFSFLWTRWSKIRSEELKYNAKLELRQKIHHKLIYDSKITYLNIQYYDNRINSFKKTENSLTHLLKAINDRFDQGDISGYEVQRIKIELNKYEDERLELESRKDEHYQLLLYLTNRQENPFEIQSDIELPKYELLGFENYIELGYKNRSDLKAAHLILKSREEALNGQNLYKYPRPSLLIAHKDQGNQLTGSQIQLNFEIPIFNFNGGNIELAEAKKNEQDYTIQQIKEKIRLDITQSFNALSRYKILIDKRTTDTKNESLLNIAILRYEKGESSMIELLDGLSIYLQSLKIHYKLKLLYLENLYQLENVTEHKING